MVLFGAFRLVRRRRRLANFLFGAGRKFVHMLEKSHELPDLLIIEFAFPCGHAGPANAVADNVEILIVRHVGGIGHELRGGRIESVAQGGVGICRAAVAARAIVAIELGARDESIIRRG